MPHANFPINRKESTESSEISIGSFSSSSSASSNNFRNNNDQIQEQRDSINSSRSSLEGNDLDFVNYMNENEFNRPYLLPIVLPPPEPTLDELLKRITGRNDIQNVETLKIRVISYNVSLQRLSLFMPRLSTLNLQGSVLNSLRDLGYDLIHLTTLNVSNCGLSSLDGTNGLTSVQTLIADDNRIESINPLGNLPLLQKLSLKNNKIRTTENLSFLALCPLIREINLEGNPVTNKLTYRKDMRRNVASLEILDDLDINDEINSNEEEVAVASSISSNCSYSLDETSSLSEEIFDNYAVHKEIEMKTLNNEKTVKRPSTSEGHCYITIKEATNQSSKNLSRPLSANGLICGSIINAARQRKKSLRKSVAWQSSSSSSLLSVSSNNSENLLEKEFPERLPQTAVDLELGVIGITEKNSPRSSQTSLSSLSENRNATDSLLELAKKWRLESSRKKNA